VRAHDPFELIRWLALSQPDPRKALAELVQNSLDAGARRIRVTRVRERGVPCLKIHDDGEGVIPEMERREALTYIATHIGHSRKRSLSPQERYQLMTQGQYGIGLLGFWSLGHKLELRTFVDGQKPHRLVLHRDDPHYEIEPLGGRLPLVGPWTEVLVAGLHREALGALIGRRAADYLASELRGQLLAREVHLVVEDRLSRGRAQKVIPVKPPQFLGERLEGLATIEVPGHATARLEIYFSSGDQADGEPRGIAVYAAGTLVANGFRELAPLGLDRTPWTDLRLTGLVDFPDFQVAPGSRHGVLVDDAADAFARALVGVEPLLTSMLESLERRRSEKLDRTLVRDLQRAFRDFYRQRPRYAMLPVHEDKDRGAGPDSGEGARDGGALTPGGEVSPGGGESPEVDIPDLQVELLPPGALASVRITPARVRVECSGTRGVRATPLDETGRTIEAGVQFMWRLEGEVGRLEDDPHGAPNRIVLQAGESAAEGTIGVMAREVVLRSHQDPRFIEPLEQLVEVVAFADRNIAARGRRPRGQDPRDELL
jgi:hypothetical protein